MIIGIPKELYPGERRVSLVPSVLPSLTNASIDVLVETSAGVSAGFPDSAYTEQGARISASRKRLFADTDIILQVRSPGAAGKAGLSDLELLQSGQSIIGFSEPLAEPAAAQTVAECGVRSFSMELIPRITRAQSMDALSSMATIAGYKAVLLAASTLPRMFPMLMTAAGTITPARVFVVGAGVAGLQAIASARRLGARVEAYDVRPDVKEQVESLGANFVELPLETSDSEDAGGYAKAQDESFLKRQREMMERVVTNSDVVITTALIPGKTAPILVTAEMVSSMERGAVVVDLAAERGGNCALTKADEVVVANGVTILGPSNLTSTVPYHASQMYSKNISTLLLHLVKDGALALDLEDEITVGTLVSNDGQVVHPRVKELLERMA